jgi:hypothetical protein
VGNVIDRLLYGHVVDFLDFHWAGIGHFPALTSPIRRSASAPACSSSTNCAA